MSNSHGESVSFKNEGRSHVPEDGATPSTATSETVSDSVVDRFLSGSRFPDFIADSLSIQPMQAPVLRRAQRMYGNRALQPVVTRAQATRIPQTSGHPLEADTRERLEQHFDSDLSDVRVHTNSEAAESAKSIDALAYTSGRDIYFSSGRYAPASTEGGRLLAHEVAHVVQQGSGKEPSLAAKSDGITIGAPDDVLETEAERAAESFMDSRRTRVATPHPTVGMVLRSADGPRSWPTAARSPLIQRTPDAPLPLKVPEADENTGPEIYPWQNPVLRETIYPYRDQELSMFLGTYMEIDLDQGTVQSIVPTSVELKDERSSLAQEHASIHQDLADAKRTGDTTKVTTLSAQLYRIEKDLEYLPAPSKDKLPAGAARKWTAYQYAKKSESGPDLTHDELLGRILDRFDADPDFKRYPKWLRYLVLHFSGMRYQSAHGSYAPATALVKRLKEEQIKSEVGKATQSELAGRAKDAAQHLNDELSGTEKPGVKRTQQIKARLAAIEEVEKQRTVAFSKPGEEEKRQSFEQLQKLEAEQENLQSELDGSSVKDPAELQSKQAHLAEIKQQVTDLESKIGARELKSVRTKLHSAEEKSREAVLADEIERAMKALETLDDVHALSILKAMRQSGSFPDWVWHDVVRLTALKLETSDIDWESVPPEDVTARKGSDAITKRWRDIMAGWNKDVTAWREKHGRDLSLVVVRAVCNEVSEMAQHARGLDPPGGIGQTAKWYAAGATGGSLTRPMNNSDLRPGAALMFLEWSDKAPGGAHQVVLNNIGLDMKTETGEKISDGFVDKDGGKYHFNRDGTITRDAPIASPIDPSVAVPTKLQHLNWKHEATVVEVDAKQGRVITYETGPIGLEVRSLARTLGQWDVFTGFAPSSKERSDIDKFLKNIVPGR